MKFAISHAEGTPKFLWFPVKSLETIYSRFHTKLHTPYVDCLQTDITWYREYVDNETRYK